MTGRRALFVGDVGMDLTLTVAHVPAADEKVVAEDARRDVGGVVANAAVACRLAGAEVTAVVAVGADEAGAAVVEGLRARGVTVVALRRVGVTCQAVITVDGGGEKRLVLVPGVTMYPPVDAVRDVDLAGVGWVHTAGYDADAAAALAARCRTAGIRWSVDLEPATLQWGLAGARRWLAGAETVFVNRHAAQLLGDEPVRVLHALGVREVVLTLGPAGARAHAADGPVTYAAPPPGMPRAIDTTGAGDALAGWYAGRRLAGDPPARALAEAVCAASVSCGSVGAQAGYPSRPDVLNHLDEPSCDDQRSTRKATL